VGLSSALILHRGLERPWYSLDTLGGCSHRVGLSQTLLLHRRLEWPWYSLCTIGEFTFLNRQADGNLVSSISSVLANSIVRKEESTLIVLE